MLSIATDKSLMVVVDCLDGKTIGDIFNSLESLKNLFSILLRKPVCLEFVNLYKESVIMKTLLSEYAPTQIIEQSEKPGGFGPSPISIETIDLKQALTLWEPNQYRFDLVVTPIRNSIGLTDISSIYGNLILAVVQLENIAKEDGHNSNKDKFRYPVERYCCDQLLEVLCGLCSKLGVKDPGSLVAELRNEISHPMKPRVLLPKITRDDLQVVLQILELIVASRVLDIVGVKKETIEKYQRYHHF